MTNLDTERGKRHDVTGLGLRLREWVTQHADEIPDDLYFASDLPEPGQPKFPSGIPELDTHTQLEGLTALIGGPKLGKSFAALNASVAATRRGWQVIYLNLELPRGEMMRRLRACAEYTTEIPPYMQDERWRGWTMYCYRNPLLFAQQVAAQIQVQSTRVLIVMDSLQRLLAMCHGDYFVEMQNWIEALRHASLVSGGRIASYVVSEQAAHGYDKGDKLRYAADVCLKVEPVCEGVVTFEVLTSRYGPRVKTSAHKLDWERARFLPAEAELGE